ncbi:MAG: hypothetical protein H2171_05160 [Opitutus sp.]|nr:hypothetical protein [Opitutus sp.]
MSKLIFLPQLGLALFVGLTLAGCKSPHVKLADSLYRPSTPVTVYLLKTSADPQQITMKLRGQSKKDRDLISLRLFDPSDKLLLREHLDRGGEGPDDAVESDETPRPEGKASAQDSRWPAEVGIFRRELIQPGIYEVRMVSGLKKTVLQLESDFPMPSGVSFQNGFFSAWKPGLSKVWFYVPQNAMNLKIKGRGITLRDSKDQILYPSTGTKDEQLAEITVKSPGELWSMELNGDWQFSAAGFPVILCEEAEAAKALGASTGMTPDGSWLAFRDQETLLERIPGLLAPEKVGQTEALIKLLDADPQIWSKGDPAKALAFRQAYGVGPGLFFSLREQNLDPTSLWGGTIGKQVWGPRLAAKEPKDRWDYLHSMPEFQGVGKGGINQAPYALGLAWAYALDEPFNPYRHRADVLNRATAAALRDIVGLTEDEVVPGTPSELSTYPGFPGFVFAKRYFPEFGLLAPHLPPEIREPWAAVVRRLFERHWAEGLVATRNQSAHYLAAFQWFAVGTGDPADAELVRRFAKRYADGASPAGYQIENGGPCGTYCGIQHYYMAEYYRLTGDPVMLEALRKSYAFYNYTVAPEPDGRPFGGFNYSHRTPEGFHAEQYGGARKTLLPGELAEVDLWTAGDYTTDAIERARNQLLSEIGKAPTGDPSFRIAEAQGSQVPLGKRGTNPNAAWPAESKDSFLRIIGGELVAVKRPSYYAAFYIGKPAVSPKSVGPGVAGLKAPTNHEELTGANPWELYRNQKGTLRPFNNAGFTTFAIAGYGNAILTGNSPYSHHGLVALGADGRRHAEDYFASVASVDESAGTLTARGQLDSLPLNYTRRYTFEENAIIVEVTLRAANAFSCESLVENIPLATGPFKKEGATITVEGSETPADLSSLPEGIRKSVRLAHAHAGGVSLTDKKGRGLRIKLDEPRDLKICRSGLQGRDGIHYDRVEVALPATWQKDQEATLRYRMVMLPYTQTENETL